jgi:hypothetical protein
MVPPAPLATTAKTTGCSAPSGMDETDSKMQGDREGQAHRRLPVSVWVCGCVGGFPPDAR